MSVTKEQLINKITQGTFDALEKHGANAEYVVKNLMRLSRAKVAKTIKVKGSQKEDKTKRGVKVIAETDEEIVLERNYKDNDTQLKALVELKKVLGIDAPAKMEITGENGGPIEHNHNSNMNMDALNDVIERFTEDD